MIRVVLDTNVIVSALLPLGPPAQIFMRVLGRSLAIARPQLKRSEQVVTHTLLAIRETALWVRPVHSVRACLDPDDDIFLECAEEARADYLVTGNRRHFPLVWAGTGIVTPRELLDSL